MVKLQAPMISLEAAGSIGGAITFQQNKGRFYARKLTAPKQPRSSKQVGSRAMFAYLTKFWQTLSTANQATWEALAAQTAITPFDAYISTNQKRWTTGHDPGIVYPVAEDDGAGVLTLFSPINQGRGLIVPYLLGVAAQNQAARIHRGTAPAFTATLENCINVKGPVTSPADSYFDTPLTAGTYWYRAVPFSDHGVTGNPSAALSGTVT